MPPITLPRSSARCSGRPREQPEHLGLAALACVACCIGPILGVLGAIATLGVVSTLFIGLAGVAITIAAAVAIIVLCKRRRTCRVTATPTPVILTSLQDSRRSALPQVGHGASRMLSTSVWRAGIERGKLRVSQPLGQRRWMRVRGGNERDGAFVGAFKRGAVGRSAGCGGLGCASGGRCGGRPSGLWERSG